MPKADPVSLQPATREDTELLENLLELYIHDMSEVFTQLEPGPNGRFGYRRLPLYWTEPTMRFAYLIKTGDRIAGFALVKRDSPVSGDPEVFDVEEYFVLRKHRRSGIGRRAAMLLWHRHPGHWIVRVSEGNAGAAAFWRSVVAEFTDGRATETSAPGELHAWRVLSFRSPA